MAPTPDVVLAFASGVPLVVLGVTVLLLRAHRPEPFFFASFAVLWGLQVSLANLGRVLADPRIHASTLLLSFGLFAPAALALVHFAARGLAPRVRLPLVGAAFLVGLVAVLVLLADSRSVIERVDLVDGRLSTTLGAASPLYLALFYGAFYLATLTLYVQYRRSRSVTSRHGARGLLLAITLFTGYYTVRSGLAYLDPPASIRVAGVAGAWTLAGVYIAGALLLAGIALHLALRPPPPEEVDRGLLAAFLVPAAVALVETFVESRGTRIDSSGVWRIATVAAVTYALARDQLFDLDLKLKRVAGPAIAGLLLGFSGLLALAFGVSGAERATALPVIGVGLVASAGTWVARARIGAVLFPDATDAPEYLAQRKLEVYRAALERAGADREALDGPLLRALRRELGISDREHEVMVFMALRAAPATGPAASAEPAPGIVLASRYRVDRLLGEGAHGRAYLCTDERTGMPVAVKVVSSLALGGRGARLLAREARVLASVRHANVVSLVDVAESPTETMLVMEYVDGGNLWGLLKRRGKLPREEALAIADGLLLGLAAAHAAGVVHRDVKPENVLLTKDGTPKLADFGVARDGEPDARATNADGAVGTLLYMAPEQVRGQPADARSDLYAVAILLHQLVTGRFYLRIAGRDDFQVRQLILEGEPQVAVRDDEALAAVLRKGLAKDPAERFASADEMRAALARAHAPRERAPDPVPA